MKKMWIVLIALCFLLVGCKDTDAQDPNASQKSLLPDDFFSAEGIGEDAYANFCLSSFYDDPRNVDLEQLFYNGFGLEVNDEERCFLEGERAEMEYDIVKLPADEMNKILEKYLGITLEESNMVGAENFYHDTENDIYYLLHTDCHVVKIQIVDQVESEDGTINIVYTTEDDAQKCIASLKKEGENYLFLSNQTYTE